MLNVCIRPQPAVAAVPAIAATAGETSSDEILVERIAAGNPQDNPEVTIQNRQTSEILLNCLTQLSPPHREVIDLVILP
jgi:DNA-directed RNA polymerase specialized sigma24 family protein